MASFYQTKRYEINNVAKWKSKVLSHSKDELNELTCGICHEVALFPVQINTSFEKRQLFCLDCVEQWRKVFGVYPGQQNSSQPLVPTYVDPGKLTQVTLGCEYRSNGCQKVLTRSQFDTHVRSCPFRSCEVCSKKFEPGSDHSSCQSRLALVGGTTHLQSVYKDLQNKVKAITDKQTALTQENIAIKKELQALREDKCEDYTNSEVTPKSSEQIFVKVFTAEDKTLREQIIALKKDNEVLRKEDKSKAIAYSELSKKFDQLQILVEGIRSDLNDRD